MNTIAYFVKLAMVAIIVAMDAVLEPILRISGSVMPCRRALVGTTI